MGWFVRRQAVSCDVLLPSDSLADLEQCESIWNFVGWLWMPQISPSWRDGPSACGGFCGSLIKNPQGWSCLCGGFPAVSQGQRVDLVKADKGTAHAVGGPSSPMKARTITWVPGDTWCWVLPCVVDVTVVVATAVARCKSMGQCYSPSKYHRRWTAHRMWGERPCRGGVWGEQISQDGVFRLSRPTFSK